MKRYTRSDIDFEKEPIMAMATINPQLCKQKTIRVEVVQGNEGNKAHVHIYWNDGRVSYVDLTAPIYAEHHKDTGFPLGRKQRKELAEIMSTVWPKYAIELHKLDNDGNPTGETYFVRATGYEAAVQVWIDTHGEDKRFKFEKDGRPIMPNYRDLPLELPKK